jgi:hypothetical protein
MGLRDVLVMLCAGLAVGFPIAFWGERFAERLIQNLILTSGIPIIFGSVAVIAIAMLAAYVPARRGSCRSDGSIATRVN